MVALISIKVGSGHPVCCLKGLSQGVRYVKGFLCVTCHTRMLAAAQTRPGILGPCSPFSNVMYSPGLHY